MKLHFDGNQAYQLDAIAAVTDVFEGQPLPLNQFEQNFFYQDNLFSEIGFSNQLVLTDEQIKENVKDIQRRNEIANQKDFAGMHFSVEMETGTGKTYVYLRTIYELNKLYGFKKFIIVVPSIAIREGVLKNLQITSEHFQSLYDNVQLNYSVYDSKNVTQLRGFAAANTLEILVINIDSFAKEDNVINKPNDNVSGMKPIEFIQGCRPIVIIDEPQNMSTNLRKQAIENLFPLCTLRYSATHKDVYNLLYSLNPVKAYNLGLVKQIEVDSVVSEKSMNSAFVKLEKIIAGKNKITAKLQLDYNGINGVIRRSIVVNSDDDLFLRSNCREMYREGFVIEGLDVENQSIKFENGIHLSVGESHGGFTDDIMRVMIQKTIEEHLKKELLFQKKGIKVLSLFFIDRVNNYRGQDANGLSIKGKFAQWFEEAYNREIARPQFAKLSTYSAELVHNGYFSADGKGKLKDTNGDTQADDETYKLIMRDKEKLLDENTSLRFIFSHSALREGWDNPNVFQICTLNESKSEFKKRQEIGRGLRLPVNSFGERIYDTNVNRLTIIANDSYEDFAKSLQDEIREDCGVEFTGMIKNKKDRKQVRLRENFQVDPKFLQIWEKIRHKSKYQVRYDTKKLIESASEAMKDLAKMPGTKHPAIRSVKNRIVMDESGIRGTIIDENITTNNTRRFHLPDPLGYIQERTDLTRSTIFEILKKSGRVDEFLINPQLFMDNVVSVIKSELNRLMIDGIRYERIQDAFYSMDLFADANTEVFYRSDIDFTVTYPEKTIYENLIPLDSQVENKFATDCENGVRVEFYFKLPPGFRIETPIGSYNPDWAVVVENESKMYLIVETKGYKQELLASEEMKIKCGTAFFNSLEGGISYVRASSVSELFS